MATTRTQLQVYAKVERNYSAVVATATQAEIDAAEQWYNEAGDIADRVAGLLRRSLNGSPDASRDHGAGVIAALSPRVPWQRNIELALGFGMTGNASCLGASVANARAASWDGYGVLTGLKTLNFAQAIAGVDSAVTIDVWMMRAAGFRSDAPSRRNYPWIASALRLVARRAGLTPRTCQALIWCKVRGSAI